MLKKLGSVVVLAAAAFALSASAGEFTVRGKSAETIITKLQNVGAEKSRKKKTERLVVNQFSCSSEWGYHCGQNTLLNECTFSQVRGNNSAKHSLGDEATSSLLTLLSREGLKLDTKKADLRAETLICTLAHENNEAYCTFKFEVRN